MVDELEEVRNRVSMLEDRINATTHEWKEKVRELEAQIFADGCEVINLKWEQAELKEQCKKDNRPRNNNKKSYRKNDENAPPTGPRSQNRYQLRNSANTENRLVDAHRDIGRLQQRISRIETRQDQA